MARRAAYERKGRGREPEQPAAPIHTAADAEEALSVEEAAAKLAEAKKADEARRQRIAVEHAASKAAVAQATKDVEAAQQREEDRKRRERAAAIPAKLAEQQAHTHQAAARVMEITKARREAYAAEIAGWMKMVERRQGWLNDFMGKHRPEIEAWSKLTYWHLPAHWTNALRARMDKAATKAQVLLAQIDQQAESYRYACTLADVCMKVGPPRPGVEMERRREQDMFYAVGSCGNGFDEFKRKPYPRPRFDWVADPEIQRSYAWLVDEVHSIVSAADEITPDHITPADVRPISEARQNERNATKADLRKQHERERAKSPVERQSARGRQLRPARLTLTPGDHHDPRDRQRQQRVHRGRGR